jgi:hypothetical protein
MEETTRPTHTFKIGQQVYLHAGGLRGGNRTGPYTVVGITRQPNGTILYRIKSSTREQLAHESELRLALQPRDKRE